MKNIFIQLKGKTQLKQEPLLKMLDIDPEEDTVPALLEGYFQQEEDHSLSETVLFIQQLLKKYTEPAFKEKLYALLVFFVSKLPLAEAYKIVDAIEGSAESITTKVRFFSLLYKSSATNELQQRLISISIGLIEKENKISIFSNFVENFDSLISSLTFDKNEYVKLYLKLINYLEKHLVYKKLWKHYIVQCLLNVSSDNVQSEEVNSLFVKLLTSNDVSAETISLMQHEALTKNKLYPYLETLLLGDFDKFAKLEKKALESAGIAEGDLLRKVKIQAIPRVMSNNSKNIQVASYMQIAGILQVEREEVEGYIIEAIQEGILRAKIDESSETIIINSVKFRTLRGEEPATLQKNISQLASKLEQIASR